jgi:Protein of unknown function (DUF5818)
MARTILLTLSLLASAVWMQAQNQYPQSSSSQTGSTSGQTIVQGCLQGSNGSYTLTSDSGTTYQLQGDTSKLSKHVGHEVEITGTTSGSSAASTTSPSAGTSAGTSAQPSLSVDKLKHISETCSNASK